ncbi:MAG: magnesium protoporphyrin IX methyltransferase [Aphanocapsa feldmannii 288cV]|nr:MAG: magnesium protoporphyrin IX methyltransferase [Aphanocapsa feldmannii 288cV]
MDPSTAPGPASVVTEKEVVRSYFNSKGFERWNRIYSSSDDVNRVQRNIRCGHQKTLDTLLDWLDADGDVTQRSFCDAGCGVGSLTLPLARRGARSIAASDISQAMVEEASRRARTTLDDPTSISFHTGDLETIEGHYDTVICLDVFIHYPQPAAETMVRHLASLAERRLLVSFAPYTPLLAVLKRIGSLFPGPSKATRAYQLREQGITTALGDCGFRPTGRNVLNTAPFYFSRLIEFERR